MNHWLCLGLAGLFVVTATVHADEKDKPKDDKDSHDLVVKDMLKTLKSAAKLFADATDLESAKKSKAGVEKLAEEMQRINERIAKLGQPTKEQEAELEKKHKAELDETVKAYQTQVQRLMKEPYGKDLVEALEKKPAAKKAEAKPKDQ